MVEARQLKMGQRADLVTLAMERLSTADRWGLLEDGTVQHGIGELLREQGRYPEAERRLRRAIELLPRLSHARLALADLIMLRGQVVEARRMLDTILEYDPEFPPALSRIRAFNARR